MRKEYSEQPARCRIGIFNRFLVVINDPTLKNNEIFILSIEHDMRTDVVLHAAFHINIIYRCLRISPSQYPLSK